jgi:hypothetical protein
MPKKMTLICLKYFLENKSSLSNHIMKKKIRKKYISTPSHTTKEIIFWKIKKNPNLPTLKNNQTSPSHVTKKNNPLG